MLNLTNIENKLYCKNILYNTNRKTELQINIYLDRLEIKVSNVSTLNELNNIKNSFINFIKYNSIKNKLN